MYFHPDTKLDRKDKLPVINEVTYLIIIIVGVSITLYSQLRKRWFGVD